MLPASHFLLTSYFHFTLPISHFLTSDFQRQTSDFLRAYLVRPRVTPAVADRPDLAACRASEVHEAAGGRNGHAGRPPAVLAGRLWADVRQVHGQEIGDLTSRIAVRVPSRRLCRHAAASSSGRATDTFCLRNAASPLTEFVPATRTVIVAAAAECCRFPASTDLPDPASQPPAVDPAVGTARTMNRCGAAPTW